MDNKRKFPEIHRTRVEYEHSFLGNFDAVDAERTQVINSEINKVAQQMILDMEHKALFGNASTCTAKEPEPLTVDALIKTVQKIRDLAPVVWYRFCEWLPDEIDGESCNAMAFKFGEDWVLFIRSGRFEIVKRNAGLCRFVEYPQERMEQQVQIEALAGLTGRSFASVAEKITKRKRSSPAMVWGWG